MRSLTPNLQLLHARTLQRLLGVALPALMLVWGLKAGLSGLSALDHAGYAMLVLAWCAALLALRTGRLHPLKAQRAALLSLTAVIVVGLAVPFALPGAAPVDAGALGAAPSTGSSSLASAADAVLAMSGRASDLLTMRGLPLVKRSAAVRQRNAGITVSALPPPAGSKA